MISIVICSINENYLSQVKENISSTIGTEYELIVWDNLRDGLGICEVYNRMAKQARYDFVCFLHEDILFETINWGHKIRSIFLNRPDIGIIGVAGCKYKSSFISGWYTGIKELDCANIIHRYVGGDEHILLQPPFSKDLENVVCIDGVFIVCRKEIWERILFDQSRLPGFHFYDIDFSVRASAICTVAVSFEILLTHVTKGGDFGDNWVKIALDYHKRKSEKLPIFVEGVISYGIDKKIIKVWLDVLKNYKISWRNKWNWIKIQKLLRIPSLYYSILKFFFYMPFGLRFIHKLLKGK
jgi:hypothetical protein